MRSEFADANESVLTAAAKSVAQASWSHLGRARLVVTDNHLARRQKVFATISTRRDATSVEVVKFEHIHFQRNGFSPKYSALILIELITSIKPENSHWISINANAGRLDTVQRLMWIHL